MLLEFFQITIIGQKLTSYFKKEMGREKKKSQIYSKIRRNLEEIGT